MWLGLRHFESFNKALLVKQVCRILTNPTFLLAACFRAKYFSSDSYFTAGLGRNPSPIWRGLFWAKDLIKSGSGWRVGSGDKINIWKDNWLQGQSCFKAYCKPIKIERLSYVSQLVNTNMHWNKDLIASIFSPFDVERILSMSLQPIPCEDYFVWLVAPSGKFCVKSAYWFYCKLQEKATASLSNTTPYKSLLKIIWDSSLPPRLSYGAWQTIRDRLPTKYRLVKRGIALIHYYSVSKAHEEILFYILLHCDLA